MKILEGPSETIIPQLKKKHEVDTLDFVFLDHWKDRYLPDTILLLVSWNDFSPKTPIVNIQMSVRSSQNSWEVHVFYSGACTRETFNNQPATW